MKNVKNIYIRKNLVAHTELDELDFELQDEFKFDYEKGDFIVIDSITDKKLRKELRYGYVDATELSISKLEKLIKKFKSKGATHIQMLHDGDHHGYQFSAFKIELADDELIQRYNEEQEKKKQLHKECDNLSQKIEIIKKDIRNLKV